LRVQLWIIIVLLVAIVGYFSFKEIQSFIFQEKLNSIIEQKEIEEKKKFPWKDISTNLMWEKKTAQNQEYAYSWNDANQYCKYLYNGGHSDWRLPTDEELEGISTHIIYNKHYIKEPLSKNIGVFGLYWSADKVNFNSYETEIMGINYRVFNFLLNKSVFEKSNNKVKMYVRCVR